MAKAKAQPKTVTRTPRVSMTQRQVDLMKATAAKFQARTAQLKVKVAELTATKKQQAAKIRTLNKTLSYWLAQATNAAEQLKKLRAKRS